MEGNQPVAIRDPTLALDSFEPGAPRAVRLEGTGFYVHGRVAVVAANPDRIHAVVRGGRRHDVFVTVDASGRIAAACDCVTFRERPAVCRHLWATLIKVQNEGLLRAPTGGGTRGGTPPPRAATP